MKSLLRYYGGKGPLAGWICAHLPPHQTYVEVFGGGAAVLFAKPPAPVEVYNDLDAAVVNLFRVVRDPALFPAFAQQVALTPVSRLEWAEARAVLDGFAGTAVPPHDLAPTARVAWAVAYFVRARMTYGGGGHQSGGWQFTVQDSRHGYAANVASYLSAVERLPAVLARLQRVQIECRAWPTILANYDRPDTLFYCDPPYVHATRGPRAATFHRYRHELTDADHAALVAAVQRLAGMVVISGYDHPIYAPLLAAGWTRLDRATVCHLTSAQAARDWTRTESLWLSPRCPVAQWDQTTF